MSDKLIGYFPFLIGDQRRGRPGLLRGKSGAAPAYIRPGAAVRERSGIVEEGLERTEVSAKQNRDYVLGHRELGSFPRQTVFFRDQSTWFSHGDIQNWPCCVFCYFLYTKPASFPCGQ